jgi:hypothetical protein
MKITSTVRVISIGNYTDTVEGDVVPMTICHLLLGHPWQYDRDVHHNVMRILARQDDLQYVIIKSTAVSLICIYVHVIS